MKFKILSEAFHVGLQITDFTYGSWSADSEYHEILINPADREVREHDKGIIDAEGNVYVDKPKIDRFSRSNAIHADLVKAIYGADAFKAKSKLMVYKRDGNVWEITDDDNNAIKNIDEFNAIKKKFKAKTGGRLVPLFKKWMRGHEI